MQVGKNELEKNTREGRAWLQHLRQQKFALKRQRQKYEGKTKKN